MNEPVASSWFNRNKGWVIPIGCLFAVFGGTCAVCAGGLGVAAIKGSGAITEEVAAVKRLPLEAAAQVETDEKVGRLLGAPVKAGQMQTEIYRNVNGAGEMRFTLPLTGVTQGGTAEVQAVRSPEAGWQLRSILVRARDGDTVQVKEPEDAAPQLPQVPRPPPPAPPGG